jgi:hypothetical protein
MASTVNSNSKSLGHETAQLSTVLVRKSPDFSGVSTGPEVPLLKLALALVAGSIPSHEKMGTSRRECAWLLDRR